MQWETATPVGFPVCMRHNDEELQIMHCPGRSHPQMAYLLAPSHHYVDRQKGKGGGDGGVLTPFQCVAWPGLWWGLKDLN